MVAVLKTSVHPSGSDVAGVLEYDASEARKSTRVDGDGPGAAGVGAAVVGGGAAGAAG